ncbi:MAG: O-antigen ligase family protein, partial [Chloroflexi bacterium]|nr:O-antigen ligase family protein [Chloroflexota bacterium]
FAIPKLTLMYLIVGVGLLVWLIDSTGVPTLPRRIYFAVSVWLAWLVLTTVFAQSPARSWFGSYDLQLGLLTQFGLMGVALLTFIFIRDARAARVVQWSLILTSIPVLLYGAMQFFQLDPFKWQGCFTAQVLSTFGNANYLGGYLAIVMLLTLSAWLDSKKMLARLGLSLLLAAQAWGLWVTSCRSATVAVAVTAPLLILWRWRFNLRQARIMLLGIVIVSMIGTIVVTVQGEKIVEVLSARGDGEIRPLTWASAAQAVAARPWIGWGVSSFDLAIVDHATPSFIARMNENVACRGQVIDRAHNLWWELLVEVGTPGLVLWLLLMAMFVDAMLRAAADDVENRNLIFAGVSALLSYGIHQLFNPSDLGSLIIFWCVLGWALALSLRRTEKQNLYARYVTHTFLIVAAFGAGYGLWSWMGTLRK